MAPKNQDRNPPNPIQLQTPQDQPIWRYMSLAKFVSLLDTSALWFTRLDQFPDRHEAAVSGPAFELAVLDSIESMRQFNPIGVVEEDARERAAILEAATTKGLKETTLANCWHLSDVESDAMWATYGRDGVAIRSTVHSLAECLESSHERTDIGHVQYVDHTSDYVDPYQPYLFKHKFYAHERELRALVLRPTDHAAPKEGVPVEIPHLRMLIHGVHLPPRAGAMYRTVIESLLQKYMLGRIAVQSSLADTIPDYRSRIEEIQKRLENEPIDSLISELTVRLESRSRRP